MTSKILLLLVLCTSVLSASYYQILGVSRSASEKQIKTAFRHLSRKYHPDRNKSAGASEKYQEITEAYTILSDKKKRKVYDRSGKKGVEEMEQREAAGGRGGGIEDILSGLFGDQFGFGGQQQRQKPALVIKLRVLLKDLYTGKSIDFIVSKRMVCSHCRGSGADSEHDHRKCPHCGGSGVRLIKQQVAPGYYQQFQQRCPHCGGQGETITKHCHVCHGKKLEESYEKNTLYIERGTVPGEEILVEEGYDEHLDGETADIRFVVSAIPDRVFKMEGHNLKAYIDLTLEEALLGFKRRFEHIDGEILDISNNNPYNPSITTRITHPNQIIKIPGKGMYKEKYSDQQGDLILVARVHLPQKLTAEQIERIVRSNIYSVGKILLPRRLSLIIVYYHKFLSSFLISYNFVDRKK